MEREILKANLVSVNQIRKKEKNPPEKAVKLEKPLIIDYMSVDVLRGYHHDLSQLKFLTSIPEGRLHFDLNHNIDKAVKRTTEGNDEKISLLLKFILDQKHRLKSLVTEEIIFISYRRSLINVMCNIYNCTPVIMVASLFNNCIYLCSLESPQEILRRQSCSELDKFCAWGYKFEQFMLSDLPKSKPDIEKPVIENEEFSMYYYTRLGNHRLFYGAQIDGMMATKGPAKKIPTSNDVDEILTFLRRNRFVELKTQKEMYNRMQVINFKKYKLLRCWCQCFLAGLKGLLVGFRNADGVIHRVQWIDTGVIVRICKEKWSPQRTVNYLNTFLNFVKESFESTKATLGESYDCTVPLTLKFDIDERHNFSVCRTNDDAHIILPTWYVKDILEQT